MKSFALMSEKRFGPFFWTGFWGAFNDNCFKNALVILIAYRAASESESGLWVNVASALFILPFFIFSPIAGQIADRFEKSFLIRTIKQAEIAIMVLAAFGFYLDNHYYLIFVLFLMGMHSTFFGPIKYSLLPQALSKEELISGNAMIELGTFISILMGTILGGLVISKAPDWVGVCVIGVATIGYMHSRGIPSYPISAPNHKLNFEFWGEVKRLCTMASEDKLIQTSIFAISWFWFFGAIFLAQIPNFTKFFVGGSETVGTLFLAAFSISIGIGALICETFSKGQVKLPFVMIGAVGMTVFSIDLSAHDYAPQAQLFGLRQYFDHSVGLHLRILIDLFFIGMFGSFYTLPLYTLIQQRGSAERRSRLIAWLNIVNSLFIVASAIFAILLYKLGLKTTQIFLVSGIVNILVATAIWWIQPEFSFFRSKKALN
jgi:MFS family permease